MPSKTSQGLFRQLLPLLLLLAVAGGVLVYFPAAAMWLGTPVLSVAIWLDALVQWILLDASASMAWSGEPVPYWAFLLAIVLLLCKNGNRCHLKHSETTTQLK